MASSNADKSAREIEEDVADARENLRDTLDELEGRLEPSALFDQTMDYFRGDGQRYLSALKREAQANPIAVGLLGIGFAWLAVSALRNADDDLYATPPADAPRFEHDPVAPRY